MNNLGPSQYQDELVVDGCCVIWTINEGLLHKRTFNFESDGQPITQALFTVFSSSPTPSLQMQSPERSDLSPSLGLTTANKALVVVLKTIMHIIYHDGGSYIVHLPFSLHKIWSIPLGILLERQLDSLHTLSSPTDRSFLISESEHQLPRMFTLSSPLEDFGMVVCNRSSLDPDEEIIFFSSHDDALCVTRNGVENRMTLWNAMPDQQARKKSNRILRRRSSVGTNSFKPDEDEDLPLSMIRRSEGGSTLEKHHSRLSDASFTMDRTSFADPDRLTVLMGQPETIKQELSLQIIESFPFNANIAKPNVFVINVSSKLDILCLHEDRAKVLHLYHMARRSNGTPTFKEKCRIPALSAAPITIGRSQRLLILSPDLILRIHAPWHTRLNIVLPSNRSWRSISQCDGNNFTVTDSDSLSERFHLDLVPQHPLVAWCLEVLDCVLDTGFYSLFLSVYGTARLKPNATDTSAFVITIFACFLAANNRSPSPLPRVISEINSKSTPDSWRAVQALLEAKNPSLARIQDLPPSKLLSLIRHARELVHHFEGAQRSTQLALVLLGLHALSEEIRMHVAMSEYNATLVPLLCQLSYWLGLTKFVEYYLAYNADMESMGFDKRAFSGLRDIGLNQQQPWSIYQWLISCVQATVPGVHQDEILTLEVLLVKLSPEKSQPAEKLNLARAMLPSISKLRDFYPLLNLGDLRASFVNALEENSVTTSWLDSLPLGVAYPLKMALSVCKRQPLPAWSDSVCELIDRKDLVELLRAHTRDSEPSPTYTQIPRPIGDISTVTEICQKIQSPEFLSSGPSLADDHEMVTSLIFRTDRRMLEVAKLLEYSQPGVTFWFRTTPTITEHAAVTAQQINVQALAIRALAMPVGKGLLSFSSRTPLPTEKFHVPGFSFVFRMSPQNTIMTVDKSFLTDSTTQWPLFHLGVAGALSISPEAKEIDTSWIVFNKPAEPTSRHAGFLLGLGLNGHLKKIARWHLLNYLTTKHVLTSVALLLGLGVSYIGTKDAKVTKLLSVHVAAMLPPGAADLKINVWIQTAGIMALGLVYYDSCHRRTSEVLLSELTVSAKSVSFSYSSSIPQELQRDESYRLACGLALGLINLGKGPTLRGTDERTMINRLCRISEGLVLSENAERNMIVAVPGCLAALALIYLRTNNRAIAAKLDVPQTPQLMEYVRPDLLFLRTVAKNLVMWDSIEATKSWVSKQFPTDFLRGRKTVPALDSDSLDVVSILAGACYVIGLRFAGTHNKEARSSLMYHLDKLMTICALKAHTYDDNISRINLRAFQDAICVALGAVMAGSGDLDVLRRLRRLHGRRHDETNYGGHMAAHMAIGFLFMSGGQYTLATTPLATACLLTATYPKFPMTPADNSFHLQALRHLWVLAAENRCLIPRSVDTHQPTLVQIKLRLKSGFDNPPVPIVLTAPCLLPDFSTIASIETEGIEFQNVVIDFAARADLTDRFKRGPLIFVMRSSITTAYRTPFEQGVARVVGADRSNHHISSITRAVQECLQLNYMEEEMETAEDVAVESLAQVNGRETSLDTKCGLTYNIFKGLSIDSLHDVKLALSAFNARKRTSSLRRADDILTTDFVERAQFRIWASATSARGSAL